MRKDKSLHVTAYCTVKAMQATAQSSEWTPLVDTISGDISPKDISRLDCFKFWTVLCAALGHRGLTLQAKLRLESF